MLSPNSGTNHTPPGYVDALVTYAETSGSVGELEGELAVLFRRMQDNDGKEIIASTINGKYFGFQVSLTVEEKFSAFAQAIRILNGNSAVCTYANFSGLQR